MKTNTLLSRISLAGLELGIAVGVGVVGGMYLDRRLDTSPWLMLVGVLLGVGSGFYNLYRLALAQSDDDGDGNGGGDGGKQR